ncbi:MAG TPA: ABC transporter ATP-binding protein [Acidobacteriota bacterium]|nr:ABC transporter ATP-binding protein [Acidobacteriota bacterium]
MTDIIIELQDVKKIYKMGDVEVRALNGVSLKVKKGEFVSIVGKSGSGKSTLVNQVGCLDTPTFGKVMLDGDDIAKMSESELAQVRGMKIGFIFQTFNLMPTLSVWENVTLPMIFQDISSEKLEKSAKKVLELVQLSDRIDHKPAELSGGQRQRVAIARALINDPEVILADEPTGNLDSKTGKQIMDFLLELNKKHGVTIIMVTHDDDLAKWAERTVVLSDGKIVSEVKHSEAERRAAVKKIEDEVSAKTLVTSTIKKTSTNEVSNE